LLLDSIIKNNKLRIVPRSGGTPTTLGAVLSKCSCKACTTLAGIRTVEQPFPNNITCIKQNQFWCKMWNEFDSIVLAVN